MRSLEQNSNRRSETPLLVINRQPVLAPRSQTPRLAARHAFLQPTRENSIILPVWFSVWAGATDEQAATADPLVRSSFHYSRAWMRVGVHNRICAGIIGEQHHYL